MPPVNFNLTNAGDYIQSFGALHTALGARAKGTLVELNVALPNGNPTIFMEASSLYLIGFRTNNNGIAVLNGGDQEDFMSYFQRGDYPRAIQTAIEARYDDSTWRVVFSKELLSQASALPGQVGAGGAAPIKESIDRLAFAIAEAARFTPIRCAVACELADDEQFKKLISRLIRWAGNLIQGERSINKTAEDKDLDPGDVKLRTRMREVAGDVTLKVFGINENAFSNLTRLERWLAILNPNPNLTPAQKALAEQRARDLRRSDEQFAILRLGDFRELMTNWQKFSALARTSKDRGDANFDGLLSEFHIRYAAAAVPAEQSLTIAEWF